MTYIADTFNEPPGTIRFDRSTAETAIGTDLDFIARATAMCRRPAETDADFRQRFIYWHTQGKWR